MDPENRDRRLVDITTQWSAVIQAHRASTISAPAARAELLERYGGAVLRYLLGAVRDEDAAEELSHEFVVRFLRGDFHRASPERGRFRDYLKTALVNLVNDHFRSQKNRPAALQHEASDPASPAAADGESDFEDCFREELLERTWMALQQSRPNYYAVLRLRVDEPELPAREIAERLAAQLDRPPTPATVRKTLERARLKFADLLVNEVAASLESAETGALEAELKELDLLRYCRQRHATAAIVARLSESSGAAQVRLDQSSRRVV